MSALVEELHARLEKALPELLVEGENIELKLKGAFKEGLICTDRRVIILKGGFMSGQMFGNNAFQQPYSNITGVEVKYGLMSGYFELSSGGMQNTSKNYWSTDKNADPSKAPNCVSLNSKDQAKKFREASSFILEKLHAATALAAAPTVVASANPQDDVLGALAKLGELVTAGVVTPDEFAAKKAELLARL